MKKKKLKTFCFDLDNTLCKTLGSNYSNSKPDKKAINLVNSLYDYGHTIKIYTARFMGRTNDKSNKASVFGPGPSSKEKSTSCLSQQFQ